ncbi:C3H1-type domain-containing protein [Durusdinium trenchii]|uniref:C3H1-type domain-containing protein n=1 Tax=Durusdinium trenchii TaxID=1381693 RepID=A0ABP0QD00_9DINO
MATWRGYDDEITWGYEPMKVQPSDMMSIWNFVESNGHAFSNVGQQEPKFVKLAGKVQKARKKSESDSDGSTATEASLGSLGHPWMCRRPCVYVAAHRASCPQGTNCGYCHLRHPQRRTTFDKRQREYLRNLTEAEMLTVLLPQLKSKALKMRPTAWKVIRILEEKLALAGGQQDLETIPMASLISVLEHMNFSWLVTLAPCKDDPDLVAVMDELRIEYS